MPSLQREGRTLMLETSFTPALGQPGLTGGYDLAIRLLTREHAWRKALLRRSLPCPET